MRVYQFWLPATTSVCVWTPGERYSTPGTSLRIASASSTERVLEEPEPPRTPPCDALPALTVIMLVPAPLIWSSMADCAPLPMATSVITADTPMIMPSIVRPVRILFRPRALNAMRNVMTGDMEGSRLPAAAAAATAAARTASAAARTAEPAAWAESAAAWLTEWREVRGRRTRFVGECDVCDDFLTLLQVAFDQLGVLSVGDPESQTDGLQLFVDVQPRASVAFDVWQRAKQRVDCGGAILTCGHRGRRCRSGLSSAAVRWGRGVAAGRWVESAIAHPLQALRAFFR